MLRLTTCLSGSRHAFDVYQGNEYMQTLTAEFVQAWVEKMCLLLNIASDQVLGKNIPQTDIRKFNFKIGRNLFKSYTKEN